MEENNLKAEPAINFDLALNEEAIKKLKSIIKWSNILIYAGYTYLAVMFVFFIFLGKYIDKVIYLSGQAAPANFGTITYSISGSITILISFFPLFFLQKFRNNAKMAIEQNDENLLTEALSKQDVFFKILAWYTIISLFFMLISLIGFTMILFAVD